MKKMNVINWFHNHPMRTKLALSFALPVIIAFIVIIVLVTSTIADDSLEATIHSAQLTYDHAFENIENQLEALIYTADQLRQDSTLIRILSSPDFHEDRPEDVLFREFLELDTVLSAAESSGTIFQAKIYIEPEIGYTNNIVHISHIAEIEDTEDYQRFTQTNLISKVYFADPKTIVFPGTAASYDVLPVLFYIRKVDGSLQYLAVGEVNILVSQIQSLLSNMDVLEMSTTILYSGRDQTIAEHASGTDTAFDYGQLRALGKSESWQRTEIDGIPYYFFQSSLYLSDWSMITLIPEQNILAQSRRWRTVMMVIVFVVINVVFLVAYLIANYYSRRLKQLQKAMKHVEAGDLRTTYHKQYNDEIGQLAQSFQNMTEQLQSSLEQRSHSIQAARKAELRTLQSQINPHLLYNTLDLINWEALDYDAPDIANMARGLARFFRNSLNKGQDLITLAEEIEQVRSYVEVENFHYNNAIRLIVDVEERLLMYACISLILQPLVENSILHGHSEKTQPSEFRITITGESRDGCLMLTVADDGTQCYPDPMASQESAGYGTKNIDLRLKLCFGNAYGLSYQTMHRRTVAVITMPLYTLDEAQDKVGSPIGDMISGLAGPPQDAGNNGGEQQN